MTAPTITLTPDDAATFTAGGRVVLVEPGMVIHHMRFPGDTSGGISHEPPDEWGVLPGVCETCDGSGEVYRPPCSPTGEDADGHPTDCPSCGGTGHPLVKVVTDCTQPLRTMSGVYHPGDCCDGSATVTLGTATAEVAPIVDVRDRENHARCIVWIDRQWWLRRQVRPGVGDLERIDIGPDPASKVGQFALILTRTTLDPTPADQEAE